MKIIKRCGTAVPAVGAWASPPMRKFGRIKTEAFARAGSPCTHGQARKGRVAAHVPLYADAHATSRWPSF
ncbi:hypothetical protein A3A67_04940 [Candidatus Peribacteria bacterium RIFCSPLOWO2_01_FULL_51_18]|nr:MAG: hypothetical protein A3C52_03635 [Candidatus Peribacteria bacterium RIFCSPHIGHO2_02_FULL_51_15]OGJ65516.1 MAG: hypothetical protein A3A67_04940 [Candidatus Peribacteria bacterium RIFCSPLOWO2_01_FULL_51_18]OGJ69388.1 MAG: hypothetical protein A3J34_04215 [Candidatus Peribacteria bacterium RIFCSPLOWO2_02_FULL_51_10]